jgi:parallel beta-helix repeat protein
MKRHIGLMIAAIAVTLVLGAWGGAAEAVLCADLTPAANRQDNAGECRITGAITAPCPLDLTIPSPKNLVIESAGSISCDDASPASSITIDVQGGNMTMESGSEITVENTAAAGGADGGNITITVSGNFLMEGTGSATNPSATGCAAVAGACISSSDLAGGGGEAGNVTITVGNFPTVPPVGTFTMEPGSAVLANSTQGSGGEIEITAGLRMDVDGLVRSFGGVTGSGSGQPAGGGPIALKSGCELTVTPDGVVSSEGRNPGADLVHLEGCEVVVNGLVQSIALANGGHAIPAAGNRCNDDNVVAHPIGAANAFTACVEIWGNNITINSIAPNNGEVNANGVRAPNRAWIDLIARFNIVVNNDLTGTNITNPYSVHANSATAVNSNSFGGVITVQAVGGTFTSTGKAVQANGTGPGSDGGVVTLETLANTTLNNSSIQATGPNGSNTRGGTIEVTSFQGQITGNATSELDASGGGGAGGTPGSVSLSACTADPAVTYAGTSTPPAVVTFPNACAGAPTPHAAAAAALAALAPICESPQCGCSKSGRKFSDVNNNGQDDGEPGLPGWQICAFDNAGMLVGQCQVTNGNGNYEFNTLACNQTYTFCEVLQPGWTQTFPNQVGGNVVDTCSTLLGAPGPLGTFGYQETLTEGQVFDGNDFGNFTECRKSGRKFRDVNNNNQDDGEPGLSGWQICAFDSAGMLVGQCQVTNGNGNYEFADLTCDQTYTFCEVLQPGWIQTFPNQVGGNVVNTCSTLVGAPGPLGPFGYQETLASGQVFEDNDFGNFMDGDGDCPKFPDLVADVTITIDPSNPTQIQNAINSLGVGQKLLILPHLGTKTENIVINKRVEVFGCSITLSPANVGAPVVTIGTGAADGTTTDVHATGSTVAGYQINGSNHLVKNVRAFGNAIGFHITSGATGNRIVGAQGTVGNGIGILIDGDGNTVDTASDVSNNVAEGARISSQGSGNTIKKSTFTENGLQGIRVDGMNNSISENKVYSNGQDGILVTGSANSLVKNTAGDSGKGNGLNGISVTGNTGPLTENTARANGTNGFSITGMGHTLSKNVGGGSPGQENALCQFVIGAGNADGADNEANNMVFGFTNAGAACVDP